MARRRVQKKKKNSFLLINIFIVSCLFLILFFVLTDSKKSNKPKTPAEARTEKIEKSFSAWDGSHYRLTKFIKNSMNDPNSYEHVETRYGDKGDHLIVSTTFRGKNASGGVVKNMVTAKVDLNGNVIAIISQHP